MNFSQVHHKSAGNLLIPASDLWWTWLRFITNQLATFQSQPVVCDELQSGSSQISWQLVNPSQWFVMNFSQVHHKSAGNLLIPASDLWWTWLRFITNQLATFQSQPVVCDELQSGSSQISWQLVNPSQWFVMNFSQAHHKSAGNLLPSQWFVMNFSQAHHKSAGNLLIPASDLWWTWLRFIANQYHMVVHHKMTYPKKPGFVMNLTEVHHKITLFPRHRYEKNQWKNWFKVLKTVWFCDEPQSSSSQTEVVPPILICDEQQLHSSEIQVHGHLRFLRSLAMGSTEIESFVMSVMPQGILDQRICEVNSSQTHDHSCKSNLRHLSTNSASFCGQGTWSPAALQVPSFFLHFVRTRLGRWLQSFTVTVIRLTSVCAFSVLKSTDFLCWKAQLKIALFSLLFLQNNWQAWLLTNYKETCQQYSWWKVGSHATYQTFSIPCHHWIPRKYTTVKLESYFLR